MKKYLKSHVNEGMLLAIIIVMFIVFTILQPTNFPSLSNLQSMAEQLPEFGLVALGMMVVIVTGGINLSLATAASLSGILGAMVLQLEFAQTNPFLGSVVGIVVMLAAALVTGLLNGFMVAYIGVSPILVTLGTMTLFEGIGLLLTAGGSVSGLPVEFSVIGTGRVIGLPYPLILFIILAIISYFAIERSAWGNRVYMTGCNEVATKFSGVDTKRVLMKVYLFSGLLAGIAGLLMVSRYSSAKSDYGASYTMRSISAVVLGGTSISGGSGSVLGTVLAVIIMQILTTGLTMNGVNKHIVNITTGVVLILVLALRHVSEVIQAKKLIAERARVAAMMEAERKTATEA